MGYSEKEAIFIATEFSGLHRVEKKWITTWLRNNGREGLAKVFEQFYWSGPMVEIRTFGRWGAGGGWRLSQLERLKARELAKSLAAMPEQEAKSAANEDYSHLTEPAQDVITRTTFDPNKEPTLYNTAASKKNYTDFIFGEGRYAKKQDK